MHSSVSSQGAVPPWVLVGAVAFLGFAVFILEQDSVIPLWPWFPSSCICEWVPPRSSVLPSARVFAGSRAQCVKNISQENNLMGNRGREQISAVRMNSGPPAHCHSMGTLLFPSSTLRSSLGNTDLIFLFLRSSQDHKQTINKPFLPKSLYHKRRFKNLKRIWNTQGSQRWILRFGNTSLCFWNGFLLQQEQPTQCIIK